MNENIFVLSSLSPSAAIEHVALLFLFSEDNVVVKVFRFFIVAVLHKIIESNDMNRLVKLMNELRMRFSCCHHKKS